MERKKIPFNKPHLTGNELLYIADAARRGKLSGGGEYTLRCQRFLENRFGFKKTLLTTSCTDALEMCAILLDIQPGDEVIVPAFTFVSTALAFVRQGAKIVFCDSRTDHPGIDESAIEGLITPRTKAIVVVHYAGVACNMSPILHLAEKYGVYIVEDAAHAIDSYYIAPNGDKLALGRFGTLSVFSFHETKNIHCGEGGLLAINDERFIDRAEIIWEKGTDRSRFFRGEIDKYGWVDLGSSFLPSEITAAFLWAQLERMEQIQRERKEIWDMYFKLLLPLCPELGLGLPFLPEYATNNGHLFYILCSSLGQRNELIKLLNTEGISAVFHYQSLHASTFYTERYGYRSLPQAERYSHCLLRLPFYLGLDPHRIMEALLKA